MRPISFGTSFRFREIAHLPADQRQAILQRCVERADLSSARRHAITLAVLFDLVGLVFIFALALARRWTFFPIFLTLLACFAASLAIRIGLDIALKVRKIGRAHV